MSDYASVIAHLDALSRRRALTLEESLRLEGAIKEEQRDMANRPRPVVFGETPVRRIVEIAANMAGVDPDRLTAPGHARALAYPRFAAMKVAREQSKPVTLIGRVFKRDHSTVILGIRRAEQLERTEPDFATFVGRLREEAGR